MKPASRDDSHAPAYDPVIREAVAADIDAVIDLAASCLGEGMRRMHGEWLAGARRGYPPGGDLLVVAEVAGSVVGFGKLGYVLVDTDPADHAGAASDPENYLDHRGYHRENVAPLGFYMQGLAVHPAHRRRGIGRLLTEARLFWLPHPVREAFALVGADNPALPLYEQLHFSEVRRDVRHPGVSGEVVLLRWSRRRRARAQA